MKGRVPEAVFRLAEAMEQAGISSVAELSTMSGVSRPTIYAMLANRSQQIRLETLGRLAFHLGVKSPGDLIVWKPTGKSR